MDDIVLHYIAVGGIALHGIGLQLIVQTQVGHTTQVCHRVESPILELSKSSWSSVHMTAFNVYLNDVPNKLGEHEMH